MTIAWALGRLQKRCATVADLYQRGHRDRERSAAVLLAAGRSATRARASTCRAQILKATIPKDELATRPMFHHFERRVKTHVPIVLLEYAL